MVASPDDGPEAWIATARRAEELGYATLLMPDVLPLLSPFPSLAVAASVTRTLRVGTFVLAAPMRTPRAAAWDAHTLSVLSGGRFELGIAAGRPEVRAYAKELGLPYGTADERRGQVTDTITHLRDLDGERHTPVVMAAGGHKGLALAARIADIVTFPPAALPTRAEALALVDGLRDSAGERADRIELGNSLFVIGDEVPPWTQHFIGADPAPDSLNMLRGTTTEMADELQRRRDTLGVSYLSVHGAFMETLAPVVERLTGR
ncbi:LLM class flavin-dependent oxidoreductase [Streptosporangium subroseum]|uniref:LLM class flavin-dependent oxidoreductase n=1 Tax=Streptosporangium subroseum TaxID=106412 RepID=UPI003428A13C